jgi:phosphoribosylformylglycinamidine synthase I
VKWGVVVFPGSNDERDTQYALSLMGYDVVPLWHGDEDLAGVDAVVLPGGFSYGDHLRAGAIARFSPVMRAVEAFARSGGPVLGICNGFQILCEAGLLPGALVRNSGLRFMCREVSIEVLSSSSAFSASLEVGSSLTIPVKNGEGCYVVDESTLAELESQNRVIFRYRDGAPNGSLHDIAGVANEKGNVVGLMPHPEHAIDAAVGGIDGRGLFASAVTWLDTTSVGVAQ